jgi:hypothetical protein
MNNLCYQRLLSTKIVYFVNKSKAQKITVQKKKYKKKKNLNLLKLIKLIILKKIPEKGALRPLKIK